MFDSVTVQANIVICERFQVLTEFTDWILFAKKCNINFDED